MHPRSLQNPLSFVANAKAASSSVAVARAPAASPKVAAVAGLPGASSVANDKAVIFPRMRPMPSLCQSPVVIAVPHRGFTAGTGIEALGEALGEALDVFAEPMVGVSEDLQASVNKPSPLEKVHSRPLPVGSVLREPLDGWYNGWRIEFGLTPKELAAHRAILSLPEGSNIPQFEGVNMFALYKKIHAGSNIAAARADKHYTQQSQAYAHDIPQLRQRIINAEQALHEANLDRRRLADLLMSHAAAFEVPAPSKILSPEQEVKKSREEMAQVKQIFQRVRETMVCPICTDVCLLPKTLGNCGHVACNDCLKQLDDVAFATLTSSAGGASARQHLMARRCPLCRDEIVGSGFANVPLAQIAEILVTSGMIESTDMLVSQSASAAKRKMDFKNMKFTRLTQEGRHIHALQIGCFAQSELAKCSVLNVIAAVTSDHWMNSVYVHFDAATSRVFFETFATTLHGKAGGVNVLVNSAQRMLTVQLRSPDNNFVKKPSHLLIKVACDGRFTIGHTPEEKPVEPPAQPLVAPQLRRN